ncbi:hypothetical protein PF003_g17383 [Phytophthora fragariae]|nr:hypothetical protein PF003_g17383 [Phytophthora fragariae]
MWSNDQLVCFSESQVLGCDLGDVYCCSVVATWLGRDRTVATQAVQTDMCAGSGDSAATGDGTASMVGMGDDTASMAGMDDSAGSMAGMDTGSMTGMSSAGVGDGTGGPAGMATAGVVDNGAGSSEFTDRSAGLSTLGWAT